MTRRSNKDLIWKVLQYSRDYGRLLHTLKMQDTIYEMIKTNPHYDFPTLKKIVRPPPEQQQHVIKRFLNKLTGSQSKTSKISEYEKNLKQQYDTSHDELADYINSTIDQIHNDAYGKRSDGTYGPGYHYGGRLTPKSTHKRKILVLGRDRKIYKYGRTQYVRYNKELISLKDARKIEAIIKKQQKKK